LANSKRSKGKERNDEIKVSVFKEIHIYFPGDVYLLVVWLAMSDRAKSTPTCKPQATLHGLANKFVSAYGVDYSNPLSSDDVMAIFHKYGNKGNPGLRLEDEDKPQMAISLMQR
jgi:hypothetical protein